MGPIPAGSTLIFETEIMGIKGVPKPETIVTKSVESAASSVASEATESASSGVAEAVASAASVAADVAGTILVDTDDVQEHNEL